MKRTSAIAICLLILLLSPLSVSASLPRVVDDAELLTDLEIADLEQQIEAIVNRYEMDIVIVTVDSLGNKSSEAFADDYYDSNGYGIGHDHSGVLLLLSMEYRDWAISTCGDTIYAITDYSVQNLFSGIAGYLSQDQYFLAFSAYLDALEPLLESYCNGSPVNGRPSDYEGTGTYIPGTQDNIIHYEPQRDVSWYLKRVGISLSIGLVSSVIALLIMRSQMNTAKAQHGAISYLMPGSYQVKLQRDIFLYSQLSKIRKSESTSSGGGGSSVHRSSSGRSHGGGHGKF